MALEKREWPNVGNMQARSYRCGHPGWGHNVSSEKGWHHIRGNGLPDGFVSTCPDCKQPTFFDLVADLQIPGVAAGSEVQSLPAAVQSIWTEIRNCTSHDAYTAAVLSGRTLLMHIAVE